jgi:hypothetical protein
MNVTMFSGTGRDMLIVRQLLGLMAFARTEEDDGHRGGEECC